MPARARAAARRDECRAREARFDNGNVAGVGGQREVTGDNVTAIDEARYQRHKRLLQEQIADAGRRAAAAFLAHLEAVARGAPREAVNSRWQAVEERAVAYQELLQTGEAALRSGLQTDLREQIDGEFEADWAEALRDACLQALQDHAGGNPDRGAVEVGLRLACLHAYRRGYRAGVSDASTRIDRGPDE
jgi:hypothetical protein